MIVAALSMTLFSAFLVPRQDAKRPLSPRERAVHLLSRFSFGPRPGEVERLIEYGEEAWIEEQLDAKPRGPRELSERLAELETLDMTPEAVYEFTYYELPDNATRKERQERNRLRAVPMTDLMHGIVLRQVMAEDQLEEVLCEFWRNHFNVSYTKGGTSGLYVPDYDARVIRDHALGDFSSMLWASAHHPAMMYYLDNMLSRRPPNSEELAKLEEKTRERTGSKELAEEAVEIASKRGLNENYARELLELHTLGVDRTYRQKDVVAAAEALTGWGIAGGANGDFGFRFSRERHIDGSKTFLKSVLREDKKEGTAQGDRLLELLARHSDTADFISMKLVRYLVNDNPPPSLVAKVSSTFKKKKGSIPDMVLVILESDEFWSRHNYQAKFKTPNEFLISAIRICDADVSSVSSIRAALRSMGQETYHCDDPTGYYDTADAWLDPGVMAKRWELALALAAGDLKGIQVPKSFFGELEENEQAGAWMRDMVKRVLPGGASTRTLAMVQEVVNMHLDGHKYPEVSLIGPQILGLLLGSPEFQKQ